MLSMEQHGPECRHGDQRDIYAQVVPLGATAMSLVRVLAHHPGRVISRGQLLETLPNDGQGEHAVEVAIGRLRTALGDPRIVQTVVKRGYRLAYEPERAGSCVADEPIDTRPTAYALPGRSTS